MAATRTEHIAYGDEDHRRPAPGADAHDHREAAPSGRPRHQGRGPRRHREPDSARAAPQARRTEGQSYNRVRRRVRLLLPDPAHRLPTRGYRPDRRRASSGGSRPTGHPAAVRPGTAPEAEPHRDRDLSGPRPRAQVRLQPPLLPRCRGPGAARSPGLHQARLRRRGKPCGRRLRPAHLPEHDVGAVQRRVEVHGGGPRHVPEHPPPPPAPGRQRRVSPWTTRRAPPSRSWSGSRAS